MRKTHPLVILLTAALSLPVYGQSGGRFSIRSSTIGGTGGSVEGGAFEAQVSAGQPAVGIVSGGSFSITGGFVPPTPTPPAGDCDGDHHVDAYDVARFQNCYTDANGGPIPSSCACIDFDRDDDVDQNDWRLFVQAITGP